MHKPIWLPSSDGTPRLSLSSQFKGNCPFHGEKTPSFYVNPATNLYYCFGCGAKGNAISFLVDFEKLTFVEALKTLSAQTGIDLPKEDVRTSYQRNHSSNKSGDTPPSAPKQSAPFIEDWSINSFSEQDLQSFDTPHDLPSFAPTAAPKQTDSEDFVDSPAYYEDLKFDEALGEHGDLYALLNAICRFYQSELLRHSIAYDYFLQRGLTKQSIENFELGYAPDGWQHLQQVFKNDIEGLKLLGLIRTSKHGRDFCLLRDRVIFPSKTDKGKWLALQGVRRMMRLCPNTSTQAIRWCSTNSTFFMGCIRHVKRAPNNICRLRAIWTSSACIKR